MSDRPRDVLCISSIDWDFIWQGHQEIMSTLAAQGDRVLFIENTGVRPPRLRDLPRLRQRLRNWWRGTGGFREERPNLFVYLADRRAAPVFAGRALDQPRAAGACHQALDESDRVRPPGRVDVSADAAGARADPPSRSGADDLLLHRRPRLELRRGGPHRQEREGDVPARRSGVRHLREAAPAGRRKKRRACTCSRSGSSSNPSSRCAERRGRRRRISPRCRGRWSATSAACINGSTRISWSTSPDACPDMTFVFVGPAQTDVSRLEQCPNVVLLGAKPHTELAGVRPRVRRRHRAVPAERLHRERLSDEAERVSVDGHSGRGDRPLRDSPVQRRARRHRLRRRRRCGVRRRDSARACGTTRRSARTAGSRWREATAGGRASRRCRR